MCVGVRVTVCATVLVVVQVAARVLARVPAVVVVPVIHVPSPQYGELSSTRTAPALKCDLNRS